MSNVVQYSVFPNCNNCHKIDNKLVGCSFCLRKNRDVWSKQKILTRLEEIKTNINYVDWKGQFSSGISLLGGEIYYMTDDKYIKSFLELIDNIIDKILIPVETTKYSTVTNGMYDPNILLFKVLDKIEESVGISRADINFSYDIKYRFFNEETRQRTLKTIRETSKRYNYTCGVQTILTQYLIDDLMSGKFNIDKFEEKEITGCQLTLLYPHPINPLLPPLPDFNFTRKSFLTFIEWFKKKYPKKFDNFYLSVYNSGVYKFTGAVDMLCNKEKEPPKLWDGKEEINPKCGHTKLYQCYSDDKEKKHCLYCDLLTIGR